MLQGFSFNHLLANDFELLISNLLELLKRTIYMKFCNEYISASSPSCQNISMLWSKENKVVFKTIILTIKILLNILGLISFDDSCMLKPAQLDPIALFIHLSLFYSPIQGSFR